MQNLFTLSTTTEQLENEPAPVGEMNQACDLQLQANRETNVTHSFELQDMERFAEEAWGKLGLKVVKCWIDFNEKYFAGELRPIPLIITPTLPFGKAVGDCKRGDAEHGRLIRVNIPKDYRRLLADAGVVLHEQVHQCCQERGEASGHQSEGWRREIMRLNKIITGAEIWAGRYKSKRIPKSSDQESYVKKINEPAPDGRLSLGQKEISRWPHSCGIHLGQLR